MRDHRTIVREAGTAEEIADRRGVSVHTVRSWILRNRIPAEQWAGFAADGKATLQELAETIPGRAAA
jgi:transposase